MSFKKCILFLRIDTPRYFLSPLLTGRTRLGQSRVVLTQNRSPLSSVASLKRVLFPPRHQAGPLPAAPSPASARRRPLPSFPARWRPAGGAGPRVWSSRTECGEAALPHAGPPRCLRGGLGRGVLRPAAPVSLPSVPSSAVVSACTRQGVGCSRSNGREDAHGCVPSLARPAPRPGGFHDDGVTRAGLLVMALEAPAW